MGNTTGHREAAHSAPTHSETTHSVVNSQSRQLTTKSKTTHCATTHSVVNSQCRQITVSTTHSVDNSQRGNSQRPYLCNGGMKTWCLWGLVLVKTYNVYDYNNAAFPALLYLRKTL
eukprot:scpid111594/ scgid2419/ 